jgi:CheY-like chemotaxis protein
LSSISDRCLVLVSFTLSINDGTNFPSIYTDCLLNFLEWESSSMKILLVEDIRVERLKLKRWLEALRCEVIEASNGIEGIDLYHAHRPELVITDLIMPEKDGVQMMIALRKKYPGVKIFAISGAGARKPGEYLQFAKGLALRTFVKPIDKGALLAAVMDFFPETNPKF